MGFLTQLKAKLSIGKAILGSQAIILIILLLFFNTTGSILFFYLALVLSSAALIFSVIITERLTSKVHKLYKAIKLVSSGNMNLRVELAGNGEITKLADAFNEMIDNLNYSRDELLFSKNFTENIIKSMQEGLLVLNVAYRIEIVNEAALKILGFSAIEELLDKDIREIFGDTGAYDDFIRMMEDSERVDHYECAFVKADGRKIVGLYSAAIIDDAIEQNGKKVMVIQDITERKRAERQLTEYSLRLEKNNKELDQFAYIVSHDLKAPLRAINNLSAWLQDDLGPSLPEEGRETLELMRGKVKRMEALINDILEYSRIGRSQLPAEKIDVGILLFETIELLSPPPTIKVTVGRNMPVITAPKVMLTQVFSNLISNAIKYNDKPEGKIHVYVNTSEEFHEFTVEDNGPGIPQEHFEKIFMIFQTLQVKSSYESTGIGLTIVKRIIEEHGGKIWVESEVGKGTKFIFQWPVVMQLAEA